MKGRKLTRNRVRILCYLSQTSVFLYMCQDIPVLQFYMKILTGLHKDLKLLIFRFYLGP